LVWQGGADRGTDLLPTLPAGAAPGEPPRGGRLLGAGAGVPDPRVGVCLPADAGRAVPRQQRPDPARLRPFHPRLRELLRAALGAAAEPDLAPAVGLAPLRPAAARRGEGTGLAVHPGVRRLVPLLPRQLRPALPATVLGRPAVRLQPLPVDGLLQ